MEHNAIWTDKYRVRTYEANAENNLKIDNFANYIQESAANHAHSRKIGYHHLKKNNATWMLSRLVIKVEKFPQIGDTVSVETWVDRFDRLFSYRDFHFLNEKNEIIAAARTSWLMLDLSKLRLRAIDEIISEFPTIENRCVLKNPNNKIEDFIEPLKFLSEFTIQYSDLDVLNHTNNVNYLKFIQNALHSEFGIIKITEIAINFISETKLNNKVEVYYAPLKVNETSYSIKILNKQTQKEVVRAKIYLA